VREVIESTHESLTHHSICQSTAAGCAGDGTSGSYLLSSIADVKLALCDLFCTRALLDMNNSAPACAYVACTHAPVLSHALRNATP